MTLKKMGFYCWMSSHSGNSKGAELNQWGPLSQYSVDNVAQQNAWQQT